MIVERMRDAAVWFGFPDLRGQLHKTRDVGLESLLDYQRLSVVVSAVRLCNRLEGDAIEFGTFRGGTAGVILQNLDASKTLHLCDSFSGMPPVASEDNFHQEGDFSDTAVENVTAGIGKLGQNFEIHAGFFCDTIPVMERNGPNRIAFAHIDADLYESVLEALEFCYPRMVPGGVMILDDYGSPSCLGAKQAADEFFEHKPEQVVTLSQPSHGCLIGGGDLIEALSRVSGWPVSSSILRASVFRR